MSQQVKVRVAEVGGSRTRTHESFGDLDERGRMVGARITRYEIETIAVGPDAEGYVLYLAHAGRWFAFEPHATRDGQRYGASQSTRYYPTAGRREDAISLYLREAMKRAAHIMKRISR